MRSFYFANLAIIYPIAEVRSIAWRRHFSEVGNSRSCRLRTRGGLQAVAGYPV